MSEPNKFLDIDLFEKINKIGHGSFGEVFKVKQKGTDEIYAAKISIEALDEEPQEAFIINLLREVNIIAKMIHPSIIRFIGYSPINFNKEKKPVIITEYLENGSLLDILELERKSRSPEIWNDTKKLITIYGIASGMSYLHSHDILHRDLKPANILMDEYLFPKIADFGLSKQIHHHQKTMTIQSIKEMKGTPIYISPEIIEDNNYTKAGDVYAFAIILFEILTNEVPFKNLNFYKICSEVTSGNRPKFNFLIEKAYRDLIERCWAQNMDDRPTFDSILFELENNPDFLTETIEKDDFFDFVQYIKNSQCKFDDDKQIIKYENLIPKPKSRIFQKVYMKKYYNYAKSFVNSYIFGWFSKGEKFFSLEEYNLLSEECKIMINEAEKDPKKQFVIGKNLIEGEKNFPKNSEIGIKYLERSISFEFLDSVVYLCQHLYKGDLIPQDLNKAEKYLYKFLKKDDERIQILYCKVLKKINKKEDAFKYFEQIAKKGNSEAMYGCAKMLFLGEGVKANQDEAINYFNLSKEKFLKSEQYLNAFQEMNENKSFAKISPKAKHFLIKQKIINKEKNEIYMKFKYTSILFFRNSFISENFIDILYSYESILIEIDYPSSIYELVLKQISNIKENFLPSINICICTQNLDYIFNSNKFINSVKFMISNLQNIPKRFFNNCFSLTQISIPPSVTVIEEFAFNNCSSLKKVSFDQNSSLLEIQCYAFKNCVNLKEINIPSSVKLFGEGAFKGCSSILQIEIPSSLNIINPLVFCKCSSLTKIEIPNSITKISEKAFKKCSSLEQIIFKSPSCLTRISNSAFKDCSSLTKIEIPSSVTKIEGKVFDGCSSLLNISIPSCVTYIGFSAFKDCYSLTQITIPSSVTSIEEDFFNGCSSLKKISIPESVTYIGYYSFCNCSSLSEIKIPTNVKSIGEGAFFGCSSLKEISIPPSVKEIRKKVFQNCTSLKTILIPSSVTSIGEDAFKNCYSLAYLSNHMSYDFLL